MKFISGSELDERQIRCDLDYGFVEGRQLGRGRSGGQVRDEHRMDYDPGRGGYGARGAAYEDTAVPLGTEYGGGNYVHQYQTGKRRFEGGNQPYYKRRYE
jgi:hypothetical protein